MDSVLLSLPLEIRHQIYSYLLLNNRALSMFLDDMDKPLQKRLFRVCRQIRREAMDYYYIKNTFIISLVDPGYMRRFGPGKTLRGTLLKHLCRAQRTEVALAVLSHMHRIDTETIKDFQFGYRKAMQEQWAWFCELLSEAKGKNFGSVLSELTIIDRVRAESGFGNSHGAWKEKREAIVPLLKQFADRIITIEIKTYGLPEGPCSQQPGKAPACMDCLNQVADTI